MARMFIKKDAIKNEKNTYACISQFLHTFSGKLGLEGASSCGSTLAIMKV
jgi:hypothetical protein